jgi:prephenate dehydratase
MKKVAYLGPPGTFSEEAVHALDPSREWEPVPEPSLWAAYHALTSGQVELAVLPIENSVEGAVGATLDLLAHEPGPLICAELALPVRHHLLARPATRWEEITTVASHPQALGQCARFLDERLPSATQLPTPSTADGAQRASVQPGVAAVASLAAAEHYGLEAIAKDIQDEPENATRFVLLSSHAAPRTGKDKTSLAVVLEHWPGALHALLGDFAAAGLNLTKLESRPAKRGLGQYLFFIDFLGHQEDPDVARVLAQLGQRAHRVRVLGSYPVGAP